MRLSYALRSHNRKSTLLSTLAALPSRTALASGDWETWVVDSASIDGSANAVRDRFPEVNLIELNQDEGRTALRQAIARCSGDYIICLNEDSLPVNPSVVTLMMAYMDANPGVGAVVANVMLPDGSTAAPVLPSLVMSGATCYRRELLQLLFTDSELELSFRIWAAGCRIERFEDIAFTQTGTPEHSRAWLARQATELADRLAAADLFLPENLRRVYHEDWAMRGVAIGGMNGIGRDMRHVAASAGSSNSTPLHFAAIEAIFGMHRQIGLVRRWAMRNSVRSVVLAGLGENIYATYSACLEAGLQIMAIADDEPAFAGLTYRGIRLTGMDDALVKYADGIIVTDVNPSQVDQTVKDVSRHFAGPVLRLWEPKVLQAPVRRYQLAA